MRVLMMVTSLEGGGGGAAYRLLHGLRILGVDCLALVQDDIVGRKDPNVIKARTTLLHRGIIRTIHRMNLDPLHHYPVHEPFSVTRYPESLASQTHALKPDLVHLQYICNWMNVATLRRFGKPVIWTCYDMWPMTGGCIYSGSCDHYREMCGRCPRYTVTARKTSLVICGSRRPRPYVVRT